jgi:hypothetical protein
MQVVYFLRSGDFVKIGTTRKLASRIDAIRTSAAHGIELLGAVPGDYATERTWHSRFSHLHARGEWFTAAPELLDAIRTTSDRVPDDDALRVDPDDEKSEHVHLRVPRTLLNRADALLENMSAGNPLAAFVNRNTMLLVMISAGGDYLLREDLT